MSIVLATHAREYQGLRRITSFTPGSMSGMSVSKQCPSLRQSGRITTFTPGVNEWHISFETVPPCANQGLLLCANGARSFEVTTLSVSAFEILEVVLVDRMLYFIF